MRKNSISSDKEISYFPIFLTSKFLQEIAGTDMYDPFIEYSIEVDLWKCFLVTHEQELEKYAHELLKYGDNIPSFMEKSADKWIIRILEFFKDNGIDKPATKFHKIMKFGKTRADEITLDNPFIDYMYLRIVDTMAILDRYKNGEKGLIEDLKERGFA